MDAPTQKTAVGLYQIFDVPCRPFVLERKIGQGTFGTVFRSRMLCGCLVATKQVVQEGVASEEDSDSGDSGSDT